MQSEFKVGDKVRCVRSSFGGDIAEGEVFTVLDVNGDGWVRVHSNRGHWHPDRFEKVEEPVKFKVGDKVRCINPVPGMLKAGVHEVTGFVDGFESLICIRGGESPWDVMRFEKIEEPAAPPVNAELEALKAQIAETIRAGYEKASVERTVTGYPHADRLQEYVLGPLLKMCGFDNMLIHTAPRVELMRAKETTP